MKITYVLTPRDVYKVLKEGLCLNKDVELHVIEELPDTMTIIVTTDGELVC